MSLTSPNAPSTALSNPPSAPGAAEAPPARILVVDDDPATRDLVRRILVQRGHAVDMAASGEEAIEIARGGRVEYDAVVSDIRLGGATGLEVLANFREAHPTTPVILVTAFGDVDGAVEAIRNGAYDYLPKPFQLEEIRIAVDRALGQRRLAEENRRLKRGLQEKYRPENIVGRSTPMLNLYKQVARVAVTDAAVLIRGESGSGKELVARTLHAQSQRADKPFLAVDCGAFASGVLESELFGHVRGAFSGAVNSRNGLFQQASGGTLFLDEIGNLEVSMQAKLLRALDEGVVRPVGADRGLPVDVRLISATNADLEKMVGESKFREDLLYRLNVVTLRIPPLRERFEDVPLLVDYFVRRHALPNTQAGVSREAMQLLVRYPWPGNVRELENVVARALAMNAGGIIDARDLPETVRNAGAAALALGAGSPPATGVPAEARGGEAAVGASPAALPLAPAQSGATGAVGALSTAGPPGAAGSGGPIGSIAAAGPPGAAPLADVGGAAQPLERRELGSVYVGARIDPPPPPAPMAAAHPAPAGATSLASAVPGAHGPGPTLEPAIDADRPTLDLLCRRYAEKVLGEQHGNKTRASEILGVDRKTLYRMLRDPGAGDDGAD